MSAEKYIYRMSSLMKHNEMDAFAAQKEAGSKGVYFARLDAFVTEVPASLKVLIPPRNEKDLSAFLEKVDHLQDRVLGVGATPLLWEAERVAQLARAEDWRDCADKTAILIYRVQTLIQNILDARASVISSETVPVSTTPAEPVAEAVEEPQTPVPTSSKRPQAPINSVSFEKVALLIENFEMDDAMGLLESMMEFSYNIAVDTALRSTYLFLRDYNYSAAAAAAHRVLMLVKSIENDAAKNEKKKILAIDDAPDVLSVVKSVLSSQYSVYGVTNHMAALKFLATNKADLILLDIEMPDMNGFALLSIIRKIKAYEKTPVLFLTGSVSVENVKKSIDVGGNDFIKKPVDAKILTTRIQKHLGA